VVDFSGTDPVGFFALTIPDFAWGQKMPKLQPLLISCLLITVIAAICAAEPQSCPIPTAYGQNASAGHFAEVNGIRMYYETYGSGPSLLLVHGNGGSIYGMRCQIAYFSRSKYVTTTECVGRAMLNVTERGFPNPVLENRDINNMCAKDSK
jgi:hypothetical protein